MKPHIDGDILLYEVGFGSETGWKALHPDSPDPPPFDYVAEMLRERIAAIIRTLHETFPLIDAPKIYLTGKDNFRVAIAKKKGYKENRSDNKKPFHYHNIKAFLLGMYDTEIIDGMEADDAICLAIYNNTNAIACTRDKDLRQCEGWHYGWELGRQPQFGPLKVEGNGIINLSADKKKLTGTGHKFFFSQLITGDTTDNIPGLPKKGPAEAYKLLSGLEEYADMEKAVVEAYRVFYGDSWREELMEQAHLLWMIRELDEEGNPVFFKLKGEYEG